MFGRGNVGRGRGPVNPQSVPRCKVESNTQEMPLYRSHKLVRALKIKSVSPCKSLDGAEQCVVGFEDVGFPDRMFSLAHLPMPAAGWYLVKYDGGYESFSPADAFEDGNVAIEKLFEYASEAAHEANRLLCLSQGDGTQPRWKDAPQWQKDSAVSGVRMIWDNPATTPEQSHEGWIALKRKEGWKWGPLKDPDKREHPCFLKYSQLPASQRLKDDMFGLVVRAKLGL